MKRITMIAYVAILSVLVTSCCHGQTTNTAQYKNSITGTTYTQANSTKAYTTQYTAMALNSSAPVTYKSTLYVPDYAAVEKEFLASTQNYSKQKGLFIGFEGLKTAKLNPVDDKMEQYWETANYGLYYTDADFKNFTYKEYNTKSKLVKEYTHTILIHQEDATCHTIVCAFPGGGTYRVLFWKDSSMVVIEAADAHWLISGAVEVSRF